MLTFYLSMLESDDDKCKFRTIYSKYKLLICHEAHKLTDDKYLVEDIIQETFLKIIKSIDKLRYDNDLEFASLICTMTRNCGYNYMRGNGKYVYTDDIPTSDEELRCMDLEKVAIDSIIMHEVMNAIQNMSPMFSEPLKLKARGYSSEEIGRLLDISPQNVRIRIYRAKKIIADMLEDKTNG